MRRLAIVFLCLAVAPAGLSAQWLPAPTWSAASDNSLSSAHLGSAEPVAPLLRRCGAQRVVMGVVGAIGTALAVSLIGAVMLVEAGPENTRERRWVLGMVITAAVVGGVATALDVKCPRNRSGIRRAIWHSSPELRE